MDFMSKMWWTHTVCTRRLYQAPETSAVSTLNNILLLFVIFIATSNVHCLGIAIAKLLDHSNGIARLYQLVSCAWYDDATLHCILCVSAACGGWCVELKHLKTLCVCIWQHCTGSQHSLHVYGSTAPAVSSLHDLFCISSNIPPPQFFGILSV
jgi:hypothetical protein